MTEDEKAKMLAPRIILPGQGKKASKEELDRLAKEQSANSEQFTTIVDGQKLVNRMKNPQVGTDVTIRGGKVLVVSKDKS